MTRDMYQDNTENDLLEPGQNAEGEFADWDAIIDAIQTDKCCLLLGPELRSIKITATDLLTGKKTRSKVSVHELFSRWLDEQLLAYDFHTKEENIYFKSNKLIKLKHKGDPLKFKTEIATFHDQWLTGTSCVHRLLSKIPFNAIVNVVPDNFIAAARAREGFCFAEDYYNYKEYRNEIEVLQDEVQLIYNLFGSYKDPASVPYTEKDELLLIKSITARNPKIPASVRNRFSDPEKSFLFLGFNLNEWYFRLVIDALGIPRPNFSVSPRVKSGHNVGFLTREYYTEQYAFGFVTNSTESFLLNLVQHYRRKGVLSRKLNVVIDYYPDDLRYWELLTKHLELNGFTQRATLWSRADILNSTKERLIDERLDEADVFIVLVGTEYLFEEIYRNRLIRVLNQSYTRTITIKTNYCMETKIPNLSKAFEQLPSDKVPLDSAEDDYDLNKRCWELAKLINCIVR